MAGCGIAGLAAAAALAQAGWRVTVLERAPAFAEVGAGLGFTGNRQPARNALLRLIPAGPAFKAGTRMTRWTPPVSSAAGPAG